MADELMVAMDVMAYGYEVTVRINGVDVGIQGGKSESKRLFGADDPMVAELPPELKNLACLKSGTNEIQVEYKQLSQEDSTGLTIELRSSEQFGTDACTFRFREDPGADDASKCITKSFNL